MNTNLPDSNENSPDQRKPTIAGLFSPKIVMAVSLLFALLIGYFLAWITFEFHRPGNSGTSLYDEALVTSIFENASQAVVEINVLRRSSSVLPTTRSTQGAASGFFVDTLGHIVTNHHVVNNAEDIRIHLYNGEILSAKILGTSPADDLAMLQVDLDKTADIKPLVLADSDQVKPGQMAVAIGSPFRNFNSISVGVISGRERSRTSVLLRPIPNLIQTDAALNPGNSGGPLLNREGEVIGINSSVEVVSSVQIGVGFAVSSNTLKGILPQLAVEGEIKRPWIGISGIPLTKSMSDSLNLPTETGIYIRQVWNESPAQRNNLRGDLQRIPTGQGDIITAIDGVQVGTVTSMVSYLNTLKPGDRITLTIVRDRKSMQIDLILDPWPDT